MKKIERALISVSDKSGLIPFAKALRKHKVEIISTGGTLKALKKAGVKAIAIDEVTGFPEMLDGRVKTLHPKIHGGLLYRRDKKTHVNQAKKHDIKPIDLVVVNLYPFEQVTSDPKVKLEKAIENIDIGGPSMLRSAAKNCDAVAVVCDTADYDTIISEMKKGKGAVSKQTKYALACKVFERTSRYDDAIQSFLNSRGVVGAGSASPKSGERTSPLPCVLDVPYRLERTLRYGENPHQKAGLYTRANGEPRLQYKQLHGKELSYNNLLDIEATFDVTREFSKPAACVIKHTNPCGAAQNSNLTKALELAIECDSMSAFGGIIGLNRPCDKKTAQVAMDRLHFFEVFVAPKFDAAAVKLLSKRKNLRLIETGELGEGGPYDMRFLKSGILLQERDKALRISDQQMKKKLKVVTKKKLTASELEDLLFAFKCVKVVKSNAIVITQERQTVGIGAGQMSRVDSVEIACRKAGYRTEGGYLASDAFFPMPDSIEVAHEHNIKAIIQPGGSVRDKDVIEACNRFGIAMVFTGQRHFRH